MVVTVSSPAEGRRWRSACSRVIAFSAFAPRPARAALCGSGHLADRVALPSLYAVGVCSPLLNAAWRSPAFVMRVRDRAVRVSRPGCRDRRDPGSRRRTGPATT